MSRDNRHGRSIAIILAALLGMAAGCGAQDGGTWDHFTGQPEGPWIGDLESGHLIVCFAALSPTTPFPALPRPRGGMSRCDDNDLTPEQMVKLEAGDDGLRPIRLGDRYRVLLGGTDSVIATVETLVGSKGGAADQNGPGVHAYLGAHLHLGSADLARVNATREDMFVVVPASSNYRGIADPPAVSAWQLPPAAISSAVAEAVQAAAQTTTWLNSAPQGAATEIRVRMIRGAGGKSAVALVRAIWHGDTLQKDMYIWMALSPSPHVMGLPATGTVEPSEAQLTQDVDGVVDLGGGRTAILFRHEAMYSWSHEILQLNPDGSLTVLFAIGSDSD